MARHLGRMGECRSTFKILIGKSAEKRHLRRLELRWEDKVIMNLKEIGVTMRNWIDLLQNRDYLRLLMNAALNLHSYLF